MEQRTWITPLNEAAVLLLDCNDDLATICRALRVVGNVALANRLADCEAEISKARQLLGEGRDAALSELVGNAEASSRNMINAVMAAARQED